MWFIMKGMQLLNQKYKFGWKKNFFANLLSQTMFKCPKCINYLEKKEKK